ncbi:MAG: TonB-dependent receptor [Alphaproteobacteria bacterium]|nr:TonB-dependent receptor [Alphaproteobacteria bacterium]
MRSGVDLNLQLKTDRLLAWFAYFYIDFQTGFTASSTNNPEADADGNIQVRPGNRIPDIPSNLWKMVVDYKVTDAWTVGRTGTAASGQFLFGDEANLTAKTPAYFVLNLHTSYQITPNLQLLALTENAFNTTYYTARPYRSPGRLASASRSERPGLHTVSAERIDAVLDGQDRGVAWRQRTVAPTTPPAFVPKTPSQQNNLDGFRLHRYARYSAGSPTVIA